MNDQYKYNTYTCFIYNQLWFIDHPKNTLSYSINHALFKSCISQCSFQFQYFTISNQFKYAHKFNSVMQFNSFLQFNSVMPISSVMSINLVMPISSVMSININHAFQAPFIVGSTPFVTPQGTLKVGAHS